MQDKKFTEYQNTPITHTYTSQFLILMKIPTKKVLNFVHTY